MGASIIRIDGIQWDMGVPNTLGELDLWGVKPLIPMIEAALLEVDEEPGHFLINEIGVKVQDVSTAINRLAASYGENAEELGSKTENDRR